MEVFYDTHIHLMTLEEPDFAAFLAPLVTSPASFLSGSLTKDYIFSGRQSMVNDIGNTLVTFTQGIVETMTMLEDDLAGRFRHPDNRASYPSLPYLRDGRFHFRDRVYDRLVLCPLVMDFTHIPDDGARTYYPVSTNDKLTAYLGKTLSAIEEFRRLRPASPIVFRPFGKTVALLVGLGDQKRLDRVHIPGGYMPVIIIFAKIKPAADKNDQRGDKNDLCQDLQKITSIVE